MLLRTFIYFAQQNLQLPLCTITFTGYISWYCCGYCHPVEDLSVICQTLVCLSVCRNDTLYLKTSVQSDRLTSRPAVCCSEIFTIAMKPHKQRSSPLFLLPVKILCFVHCFLFFQLNLVTMITRPIRRII